jgi:translation elongation factor EF-4
MKAVKEAHVGETLYCATTPNEDVKAFAKFTPNKPSIYAGFFPFNVSDYDELKRALERLALNDSSVSIIPDSSSILGLGWKIGFLGMLHLDVFAQRLDQEYDANVILTCPSVEFKAKIRDNETIRKKRYDGKAEILIKDASQFPEHVTDVEAFYEPVVLLSVISPYECSSAVNTLCIDARGERVDTSVITEDKTLIKFRLPLAEVITGFFDELKRITR